jgi:hypothetical protein
LRLAPAVNGKNRYIVKGGDLMGKAGILKKLDQRKKMFEDYLKKNKKSSRSPGGHGPLAAGPKKQGERGS